MTLLFASLKGIT